MRLSEKAQEKVMLAKPERNGRRALCTFSGEVPKVRGPAGAKAGGRSVFMPRMFQKYQGRP